MGGMRRVGGGAVQKGVLGSCTVQGRTMEVSA